MTRAVSVVIERSPGGGRGYLMQVGKAQGFRMACSEFRALTWVRDRLVEQGAEQSERGRVVRLVAAELKRKARAEVTAEVRA